MVFLETERLTLRNVRQEDGQIVYDYRNHELCARYQRGQTKDLEGILALLKRREQDTLSVEENCMLAVALKDTDEMIGEIVVMPTEGTFSLGYTFSYRHHRKGYAFEALSSLMALLREHYGQWEFVCFTDPKNLASANLLRKLGYHNFGYLASRDSLVFGKYTTEASKREIEEAINGR